MVRSSVLLPVPLRPIAGEAAGQATGGEAVRHDDTAMAERVADGKVLNCYHNAKVAIFFLFWQ